MAHWLRQPRAAILGAAVLAAAALVACRAPPDPNAPTRLTDEVSVSPQVPLAKVKAVSEAGFRTIVNLRVDGETPGQPSYADMQHAAMEAKLAYGFVPLKKSGPIAPVSVEALASTLKRMPKPALLYAESKQRAAHAWALAEASKSGGLDAAAIAKAVKEAGPPEEDFSAEIAARIAARKSR